MRILLTNDDGVDAPALVPFARALTALGEVAVVVPDRERSWVGKAISRVEEVAVARVERDGVAIVTCTGYPADAAQLGIHVLADAPPDLVVSGINVGFNHGAAFLMSSGTVGAAVEGWISGVPAVAFSTGAPAADYDTWRDHVWSPAAADGWLALAGACSEILADVLATGLTDVADVISVNLPFDATAATPRRLTRVARVRYDKLFQRVGPDRYRHRFSATTEPDDLGGTDVAAVERGCVSITPVRMPDAVVVDDDLRRRIERRAR